jgi:hypothetical protein
VHSMDTFDQDYGNLRRLDVTHLGQDK